MLLVVMIEQTNKSRCAKNKQYQRILKSKSCKHQLSSFLHLLVLMLMLCGDIHPNPGPVVKSGTKKRTPKFPCSVCDKGVISSSKAVSCDRCDNWTHIMCCEVSVDDYNLCLNSGKPISHVCNVCLLREMVHQNFDETLVNPANYDDVADDCVYEPFSKKGLHFLHLNARSLLSKLSDVRLLVNNSKAAVLAVSETWLDGSVTDAEIELVGYTVVRKDRNRNGGGVCLYVRSDISYNPRTDLLCDNWNQCGLIFFCR